MLSSEDEYENYTQLRFVTEWVKYNKQSFVNCLSVSCNKVLM